MTKPFSEVSVLVLGAHTGAMQFLLPRFPAPGDYLVADGFREAQDGAKGSNQAIAAARLGARVTLLSAVGADERGRYALGYMAGQGIDVGRVRLSNERPTGFGAGFCLADGSVMGATYVGAAAELTPDYVLAHRSAFAEGFDVFLASLELPTETVLTALELARAAGIPLSILNPSPADSLLRREPPSVDILTPNEPEARLLAGYAPDGRESMPAVTGRLAAIYRTTQIVVTLGPRGCYWERSTGGMHLPAPRVQAVDSSGAGDCFNSALAVCLAAGKTMEAALEYAVEAASLSVTRADSWPAFPAPSEVDAALQGHIA